MRLRSMMTRRAFCNKGRRMKPVLHLKTTLLCLTAALAAGAACADTTFEGAFCSGGRDFFGAGLSRYQK